MQGHPDRNREARLRRRLKRHGLYLAKSRSRTPENPSYGGYMVCIVGSRSPVLGAHPILFGESLDTVEEWLVEQGM